jgi:hypothetical protein
VARREERAYRRSLQTASGYSTDLDSLIVTHPFHPLAGQRVSILLTRTYRGRALGRVYTCEGGPLGTVTVPEQFTDRGVPPARGPLTAEVLLELAAVVSAIRGGLTRHEEGTSLVST